MLGLIGLSLLNETFTLTLALALAKLAKFKTNLKFKKLAKFKKRSAATARLDAAAMRHCPTQ